MGDYFQRPNQRREKIQGAAGKVAVSFMRGNRPIALCLCISFKSVVVIALNAGMRKSEILNLRREDVDLLHRRITVRKTKNNEMRIIPINELLHNTLCGLPSFGRDKWLFPGEDGKPIRSARTGFMSALRRAGIRDFPFRDLRHAFASHLIVNGASIRTVQEPLGHKDIKMTMRYAHLSRKHVQQAMAQEPPVSIRGIRKSLSHTHAPVAQLDRAPDFGSGCCGFNSCRARF